ncbi:MAG: hypothetical protein ACREQ9_18770, partial [Candidatus Binatia bacterium]
VRLVGDGRVLGNVTAHGIVVADVPLHVVGSLTVDGLLLAHAGLVVEGLLVVSGALWTAQSLDLPASGRLELDHDPSALADVGNLRPATLPREAVLGAWRELW